MGNTVIVQMRKNPQELHVAVLAMFKQVIIREMSLYPHRIIQHCSAFILTGRTLHTSVPALI